jgi:16S rRNA (cytosine967-C5)-methyltransferase
MADARTIACNILQRVDQGTLTLDHLLEEHSAVIDCLNRSDRALVHALVYGVLRWRNKLDWLINYFAAKPQKKIAVPVLTVLRLGLFQLFFMDRIPASAAVNTSVDLVKNSRHRWAAGFINALLRRAAKQDPLSLPQPERDKDLVSFLSITHALPPWIIQRWLDRFGEVQLNDLAKVINTIPTITLRTNTLRTTREKLIAAIKDQVAFIRPTSYTPEGIAISSPQTPMVTWPAYCKGWFQVQDEAAQLVTHMLALSPGLKVWDACAGLGTKTGHIAQMMLNRGVILASDLQVKKLEHLSAEMRRMGMDAVQTDVIDLNKVCRPPVEGGFDRILVDAPCSGLGVLQKNPDGKWRVQSTDLKNNGLRQKKLLCNAASHLKPRGILVYAVCSFEPEETTHVVQSFLQMHPDFAISSKKLTLIKGRSELLSPGGFLLTLPQRHAMDGFFAAAFIKQP